MCVATVCTLAMPLPILLASDGPVPGLRFAFPAPGALDLRPLPNISWARASFLRRWRSMHILATLNIRNKVWGVRFCLTCVDHRVEVIRDFGLSWCHDGVQVCWSVNRKLQVVPQMIILCVRQNKIDVSAWIGDVMARWENSGLRASSITNALLRKARQQKSPCTAPFLDEAAAADLNWGTWVYVTLINIIYDWKLFQCRTQGQCILMLLLCLLCSKAFLIEYYDVQLKFPYELISMNPKQSLGLKFFVSYVLVIL